MRNFFSFLLVAVLAVGLIFALFNFFGKGIYSNIQRVFDKNILAGPKVISKFAVISDTHSDDEETEKAVKQAKSLGAKFIIDTGDWTTVGTLAQLQSQKAILDASGLPYWGVLGDHDRWQSGEKNFETVFGKIYQSFDKESFHFILLDASDITNGFGQEQLDWFEKDVSQNKTKPILIFMHLPVYHPTSDRTIASKAGQDAERDAQVSRFLGIIKGRNVLAMFSGDHHLSEIYTEPQTGVKIVSVGAVTRSRNLQTPRFDLVEIREDSTINIKEEVIN